MDFLLTVITFGMIPGMRFLHCPFFFLKITSFRAPIMSQKKGDSARENKKVSKGWIMLNVKYKGQRLRDNI